MYGDIKYTTFSILDFYRHVQKFKNDEELGADIRKMANALLFGDDSHEFAKEMLNEAREYRAKKSAAGKKGNEVRWAKTERTKEKNKPDVLRGHYNNVKLSGEEFQMLSLEIPNLQKTIEEISEYMASSGKNYKDFVATIRKWYKRSIKFDEEKSSKQQSFANSERERAANIVRAEFQSTMNKFKL